ncbi:MAG: membrane protein insertase YidC [Actinobacteria bacterium]|nr:membrane protein insertase YidC [Actinomycetota bacterium]NDG76191.1 membrane protein insertase YidC [Acidimicrobiia bacterium]NBO32761.1 membrane protein insertase YidC [Actinomycetota bacterium]NBO79723.1 membrane protein insertase YidC [Actinomycetota bacterium]NBP17065.1 membrane protein insertase YidC [Actinomycetota bacterium]
MFDWLFNGVGWLVAWIYSWSNDYSVAIGSMAIVVMLVITPLTLKSTRGMLEMQRLQPELRRLQIEHKGDRQGLNDAMMKLYQEHKVNPLASCLPLVAQMPVFMIMFRLLKGLTYRPSPDAGFAPKHLDTASELYRSLVGQQEMRSIGLDLAVRPIDVMRDNFVQGLVYAALVVGLALLYLVQQRMVASRTVSPTMSASQQKLLQYLPVVFAVFQVVLPTGLVVYYAVQAVFRIGQQAYITKRFYGGDDSIGRQAQQASAKARELKDDDTKKQKKSENKGKNDDFSSKRVTPPKNKQQPQRRPTPPRGDGPPQRPKPPKR